jgi:hypothetical protein
MRKVVASSLCCLTLMLLSCAKQVGPQPGILGVRLGMSKDEARRVLGPKGQLEKQERKQQEVWALANDASYSHLIVGYNKEYTAVRFVTAVASDQGRRVPYSEVLDVQKAKLSETANSHTYILEVPPKDGQPGHLIRAIGGDPRYLKYYSIEVTDQSAQEEADEDTE